MKSRNLKVEISNHFAPEITKDLKSHFCKLLYSISRENLFKMHILQPKHAKLKPNEVQDLLKKHNISLSQMPKIKIDDPALPKECMQGDVIKIERKDEDKTYLYYRVVA